ncbi:hypothetical protein A0H81_10675 [Grifola frondosa]|uniref:Uncharacterized protein n=1 Tax=Grifola frondosa TaxID=5627 RepID=A0A1C7LXM6_GRIFR|nr:hypothetical protein A0H81_10675 [Grifola frondosa]
MSACSLEIGRDSAILHMDLVQIVSFCIFITTHMMFGVLVPPTTMPAATRVLTLEPPNTKARGPPIPRHVLLRHEQLCPRRAQSGIRHAEHVRRRGHAVEHVLHVTHKTGPPLPVHDLESRTLGDGAQR